MTTFRFEQATERDVPQIVGILLAGKAFMEEQGNSQWELSPPTEEEVKTYVSRGEEYLLRCGTDIAGVCRVVAYEPDYDTIEGKWQTEGKYLAVHRVAVATAYRRQGVTGRMYREIASLAVSHGIFSLRADTHRENLPMRGVFQKYGFVACGTVLINNGREDRLAYEKVLEKS